MKPIHGLRPRWHTKLVVALCVLVICALPVAAASDKLRWWYARGGAPSSVRDGPACVTFTQIVVQELGKSGVTRLKAKFERRAPYDTTGFSFTVYSLHGWYYGTFFPNDYLSYQTSFYVRIRHFPGGTYKIRAVMVGERPSFWQRDVKIWADLSPLIGCEGGTIVSP